MFDNISLTGITPLSCYPDKKCFEHYKQNIETVCISVPCEKPEIESIEEVKVSIDVIDYKCINTILGAKLIIKGEFRIKVIYTANNRVQSVHSAHWCVPFYDFILLENLSPMCLRNINNVFSALEDISINAYCSKTVDLSLLYIMCPIFAKKSSSNTCDCDDICERDDKCPNRKPCKKQKDDKCSKCDYEDPFGDLL